jgi:hypothetical protein
MRTINANTRRSDCSKNDSQSSPFLKMLFVHGLGHFVAAGTSTDKNINAHHNT